MNESNDRSERNANVGINQFINAGAVDPLVPRIFKLNVDCFEHLFEWFSLNELKTLRLTCKRIRRVVDYYIKLNFQMNLWLCFGRIEYIMRNHSHCNNIDRFTFLSCLYLATPLKLADIEGIKNILEQIECLTIHSLYSSFDCNFHADFLTLCLHLKHLSVYVNPRSGIIIQNTNGNEWLHQHYPSLEHFHMDDLNMKRCPDLNIFFIKNPNVRMRSLEVINYNEDWLLDSTIKVEWLHVSSQPGSSVSVDFFDELHKRGSYQHLSMYDVNFEGDMPELLTLRALKRLHVTSYTNVIAQQPFAEIRELDLDLIENANLNTVANHFPNVQRICMPFDTTNLFILIQQCRKLRQIELRDEDGPWDERKYTLDVMALDRERKKIPKAQKVTIFLSEKIFLEIKWTQNTNLSLVELKPNNVKGNFQIGSCCKCLLWHHRHHLFSF